MALYPTERLTPYGAVNNQSMSHTLSHVEEVEQGVGYVSRSHSLG